MINNPQITAEIAALHEEYEAALVSNDIEKLVTFFWDSPWAVRFGVNESLYGAKQIEEFRKNRPAMDLAREVRNLQIVTFADDCAVVTLEFTRMIQGSPRHGRQSQIWRKLENGWKIVSAHVSFTLIPYMDMASALVGLTIPREYREGVQRNIERSAAIARPLLDYPLEDSIEAAPVFHP
jgi:ketosteroid isomerase-like protein